MRDDVAEAFRKQANWCISLGSPFTARLCDFLRTRLTDASRFGARIWSWPGDPVADALALRTVGGLHALARSGAAPALTDAYPPHEVDDENLWAAVTSAIADHDAMLHDYLDSPPQTNEVARSGALLGLALLVAKHTGLPLRLFEIGSSAGLNLNFDRYTYDLGQNVWGYANAPVNIACDWRGTIIPDLDAPLRVIGRFGCDQHPLDASDPAHRNRLISYIWPDQRERLERLRAALDFAAAAGTKIERSDAADFVARHFEVAPDAGSARVLMHTIMWQYMQPETRAAIAATMAKAGARATADAPLAWIAMEATDSAIGPELSMTLWPGGEKRRVGTANAHGRWVEWAV